jgi:hypothetical protein
MHVKTRRTPFATVQILKQPATLITGGMDMAMTIADPRSSDKPRLT